MKINTGLIAALVSVSLLSGCLSFGGPRDRGMTSIVPDSSRVSAFVGVTENECPVSGPVVEPVVADEDVPALAPAIPVLIGALAPIAADFVVGLVSAELERAQNELSGQWVATGPVELAHGSCLVIVRGPVGKSDNYEQLDGSMIDKADATGLGLAAPPAFYLEAAITEDKSGEKNGRFIFQTRFIEYGDTAAIRRGKGEKEVAIVLALRQTPLATDVSQENIKEGADAVIPLGLGRLSVGRSFGVGKEYYPDQARAFSLIDSSGKPVTGKVNAVALVGESEDPSLSLKVLGKAFEGNKDGLKDALIDIFKSVAESSDEE